MRPSDSRRLSCRAPAPAAAAACSSSKCSRAARRHDIGSRQPRSASTRHEPTSREHQHRQDESLAHCRRRSPSRARRRCALPSQQTERAAAFSAPHHEHPGSGWPAQAPRRRSSPQLSRQPQIPIAAAAPPAPTSRDFVPGRFSDVGQPQPHRRRRRPRNLHHAPKRRRRQPAPSSRGLAHRVRRSNRLIAFLGEPIYDLRKLLAARGSRLTMREFERAPKPVGPEVEDRSRRIPQNFAR